MRDGKKMKCEKMKRCLHKFQQQVEVAFGGGLWME